MSGSPEGVYEAGIVNPGVPHPHPTESFWQKEPHTHAKYRSPWPSVTMDVVIIGTGVTGTNLAYNLLKKRPELRVAAIDARDLCSGATGRNGGHIKTMAFAVWEERKRRYGIEEAIRLTEFEHSHLGAMTSAAREKGIDCDILPTEGLDAYFDQDSFDRALTALKEMRAHAPSLAKHYTVHTDKGEAAKLDERCVGAISVPAVSIWPYKLVAGLMGQLIDTGRLNVQTNTVVTSRDIAMVRTNRGNIEARAVVHATNGWLGHLLPELRPFVSPVRGNVVQYTPTNDPDRPSAFGYKSQFSYWLRYTDKDYDYLIQRKQGDVIVGRANSGRRTTGDDSETDLLPMAHLGGFVQEVAKSPAKNASEHLGYKWSGILGFTQDGFPFVGRLPFPNREHQWVCGGYHGIGMTKAFRSAEMLALMLLGEEVPAEYPRSMLVTEERIGKLRKSLDRGNSISKAKL
ncbi:unnamed protein product, partial [Clonostachys rosea]